jgi:hypothetical protein
MGWGRDVPSFGVTAILMTTEQLPTPLHPAAAQAYAELGLLK